VHSSWRWHQVDQIKAGFDAEGKLAVGDRIIAVDGVPILARGQWVSPDGTQYREDSLTRRVNEKKGQPIAVTVLRDGEKVDVSIRPKMVYFPRESWESWSTPVYLLGIVPSARADVLDVGIGGAIVGSLEYPVEQTKMIAGGLYDIIRGREEADPGGPKRIFDEFAKAWQLGPVTGIQLLMLLSVYLGLFNLFPLPALDGGRLVFLTYELVTRRRANPKIEAMVHMAGIMVLGVVMILVTLNDFHLFS
jgi:regulator of sigma E protease